jgi:hypothetical protein
MAGEDKNNTLVKALTDVQITVYRAAEMYDALKRAEARYNGTDWDPRQSRVAALMEAVEVVTEETQKVTHFTSPETERLIAFRVKVQLVSDLSYVAKTQCEQLTETLEKALANGTVPLGLYTDPKEGEKLMAFDAPWLGIA